MKRQCCGILQPGFQLRIEISIKNKIIAQSSLYNLSMYDRVINYFLSNGINDQYAFVCII